MTHEEHWDFERNGFELTIVRQLYFLRRHFRRFTSGNIGGRKI